MNIIESLAIIDENGQSWSVTLDHTTNWITVAKLKHLKDGGIRPRVLFTVPSISVLKMFKEAEFSRQWLEKYGLEEVQRIESEIPIR